MNFREQITLKLNDKQNDHRFWVCIKDTYIAEIIEAEDREGRIHYEVMTVFNGLTRHDWGLLGDADNHEDPLDGIFMVRDSIFECVETICKLLPFFVGEKNK